MQYAWRAPAAADDDGSPLLAADATVHRASAAVESQAHPMSDLALKDSRQQQQQQGQKRGERVKETAPPERNGTELRGGLPAGAGERGVSGRAEVKEEAERACQDEAGVARSAHSGKGGGERRRGRRLDNGKGACQEKGRGTRSVGDYPSLAECGTLPTQAKGKSSESVCDVVRRYHQVFSQ